jgi:hypothetical protein
MTSDKNLWSTFDLQRYYTLLKKQIDAAVLPELTLTDDEQREVERYRLGLVERIDVPRPQPVVNNDTFIEDVVPTVTTEGRDRPSVATSGAGPALCPYCGGRRSSHESGGTAPLIGSSKAPGSSGCSGGLRSCRGDRPPVVLRLRRARWQHLRHRQATHSTASPAPCGVAMTPPLLRVHLTRGRQSLSRARVMKAFSVGLYLAIRSRHASVRATEDTDRLLSSTDTCLSVKLAKSCDCPAAGRSARPTAAEMPAARNVLRSGDDTVMPDLPSAVPR